MITVMLSASSANAMEVFNTYVVSQIQMDAPVRKAVQACFSEKNIFICKIAGELRYYTNGTANYVEKYAVGQVEYGVREIGFEKPVAIIGYIVKIVREKKIKIGRLKLPLIANDSGSVTLTPGNVVGSLSWNF